MKHDNKPSFSNPYISIPKLNNEQIRLFIPPKKVKTFEFYTISDGIKRVYTNSDALKEYGQQQIIHPGNLSYINLFINGILQPLATYTVENGKLTLETEDIPPKGTPIILQMVVF